jgi:protein-tyrosine phosphatase
MQIETIDFHSHILPGMDDGSPNVSTSLEMLRAAAQQGVRVQVLTPHYYRWRESIETFTARRAESAAALHQALEPGLPQLLIGAEVAFFPRMSETELSPLCIGGSRVLLVELPFENWDSRVEEELAALTLDRGYRVILAHVERYLRLKNAPDILENLSALPLRMQVNAEAFSQFSTRKKALAFFRSEKPPLLGSDAHNMTDRRPNLSEGRRFLSKKLGEELLRYIDEIGSEMLREEIAAR